MHRNSIFAFLTLSLIASSAWSQATTLREAAANAGLNIGIATNSYQLTSATSAYSVAAKTQFNLLVCENEMKFENTENPIGTFKYTAGDAVSAFAVANTMKMRGHNFIWHGQSSSAQSAVTDRTTGLTVMRNHIEAVGGHFKDKILEWDVLNETYSAGTGSFWYKIGADYTDSGLAIARRVIGTSGYLYSNDYGADGVNSKSTGILNNAKKWQTNKVPIDGIGFQCHLGTGINKADISANIKRFGDIGLRVSLTEIDITNAKASDWTALMGACLENYNCVSFVTWGMSDANSWIGSTCGCLLYNGSTPTAKADMFQAVLDALNNANPAISAKRKAFAAIPPGSLGPNVSAVNQLTLPASHRGIRNSRSSVPVFSVGDGSLVDLLGRNHPIVPVSAEKPSLDVQP